MKKPAKPKPRPRRRGQGNGAARPVDALQRRNADHPLAAHRSSRQQLIGGARAARSIAAQYPSDDRAALALLLLPFLILSATLASSHAWRQTRMLVPDILARQAPTAPSTAVRTPVPPVVLPGAAPAYPPAAPAITIASLDAGRPAPVLTLPGAAPTYPPAPPAITVESRDARRPEPTVTLPGAAPAYPPAPPAITVASLDARPPVPAVALPGAIPSYPPTMPWLPPADPAIDIASWSPPLVTWGNRLSQPPTVDLPQIATWTSDGSSCRPSERKRASYAMTGARSARPHLQPVSYADPAIFGRALAAAALTQTAELVFYTARYRHIAFPMGDISSLHGTCTDVVIRAYRTLGVDLQQLVHAFRSGRGDPNIDHRRTETLRRFFTARGASLPITAFPEDYKPGDIVTYHRPFGRISNAHIAIVSDRLSPSGRPMVVHNRGFGPQLEDALFADRITGHFRFSGPSAATLQATTPLPRAVNVRRAGFSTMGFSTGSISRRPRAAPAEY